MVQASGPEWKRWAFYLDRFHYVRTIEQYGLRTKIEEPPSFFINGVRYAGATGVADLLAALTTAAADEFVAAERVVLDAVSAQSPPLAILREARAEQIARIKKLRAQVSRRKR